MPLLAALERLNIHYRQYLSMHCAPIERNCIGTDRPCPARYALYEDRNSQSEEAVSFVHHIRGTQENFLTNVVSSK